MKNSVLQATSQEREKKCANRTGCVTTRIFFSGYHYHCYNSPMVYVSVTIKIEVLLYVFKASSLKPFNYFHRGYSIAVEG